MRIDRPVRRHSRLSLTPLIDVIFLLLLFFMLSSTFSRYAEINISGGGSGSSQLPQPDVLLSVSAGELKINGTVSPLESVVARLGELKESGARHLLVIVGADAASQDFVALMAEVSKADLPATIARSGR